MSRDALFDVLVAGVGEQHKAKLIELLKVSVGRVLDRGTEGVRSLVTTPNIAELNHIRDWLLAAIVNQEHWLERKDTNGVPLKLAKFGKIEQILAEADKAMRRNLTKGIRGDAGGEVVHSFNDGWQIVKLNTPEELDGESAMMQHCVGQGSYDELVLSGHCSIFSLRDPFGKSHVTINCTKYLDDDSLLAEEISGKQNAAPKKEYFDRVLEWLRRSSIKVDDQVSVPNGYAVDSLGSVQDLNNLKDGESFSGDVRIYVEAEMQGGLEWLQKEITIEGSLSIAGTHETARYGQFFRPIGEIRVKVDGSLSMSSVIVDCQQLNSESVILSSCFVKKLPENIRDGISFLECEFDLNKTVEFSHYTAIECCNESSMSNLLRWGKFAGNVEISRSKLKIGRGGLNVAGRLALSNLTAEIEGPLLVDGALALNNVVFNRQPYSLWVRGHCDIHKTSIPGLPNATFIGGDLAITEGVGINEIASTWDLRGGIILRRTAVEKIDKSRVFGELHLSDNRRLKSLPSGLRVSGSLYLAYQDLGLENIEVQKLELGWDAPQVIGDHVIVNGDLELRNPKPTTIPDGFVVGGNLIITPDCRVEFAGGLIISGSLLANGIHMSHLPENLSVNNLDVSWSSLRALPKGLRVAGCLDASHSLIDCIPPDLEVAGWANFRDTNVTSIPPTASIGGEVTLGVAHEPAGPRF
jgi:hypothetical protein